MTENSINVKFRESPRDFRTEVPNIVSELVELGLLSHWARTLYTVYRKIAGEHGACWVGERGLAKKCGFSRTQVLRAKKELLQNFELLNGKSLIFKEKGNKQKEEADVVTIEDIWIENHQYFKKDLRGPGRTTHGPNRTTHGPILVQKNEPTKKEPIKKETISKSPIVHKFVDSFVSASPIPAESSLLSNKEEIDLEDELLFEILDMEKEYLHFFRRQIVLRWIKKNGTRKTLDTIKLFFETRKKSKVPILNPEAWMETALKNKFTNSKENDSDNKLFAEKLKKQYNLSDLKINKRYCRGSTDSLYYHLPRQEFQSALRKMYHLK